MTAAAPAIDVKGLSKAFGSQVAVRDLDLKLAAGRVMGFLGANGSGKTTTIRMLCGLLVPDRGTGTCLGYDILTERSAVKRRVGYMPQRFGLYEDMTVRENMTFVARLYKVANWREAVEEAIGRAGLDGRSDHLAGTLSGGLRQRLALATCMIHHPALLLLDEPTAGVDPGARREFWDQIHELAAAGITVLVSTHYMDEAEKCHEIGYFTAGRMSLRGTPQEIIGRSGLATWSVGGGDPARLAPVLKTLEGVDHVYAFGAELHVSGSNSFVLEKSLKAFARTESVSVRSIPPSLEDVFIHLLESGHADE